MVVCFVSPSHPSLPWIPLRSLYTRARTCLLPGNGAFADQHTYYLFLFLCYRAGDVAIWSWSDIDAYLLPLSSSVNDTLSKYLGRPAQLALKGPRERVCEATVAAPTLGSPDWPAEVVFQDGYPLLVASLESARAVQDYVRSTVGKQGVAEKWKEEELAIERYVLFIS